MRARFTLLAALLTATASAQESETPDPLFRDSSILQATVTGPLTTLVRERSRDEYLPGVFAYTDSDGNQVELDLEIRARGHFRHQNCDYPPVLLNFRKKQTTLKRLCLLFY